MSFCAVDGWSKTRDEDEVFLTRNVFCEQVKLWRLEDAGTEVTAAQSTALGPEAAPVECVLFHPSADGVLASGAGSVATVWDLVQQKPLAGEVTTPSNASRFLRLIPGVVRRRKWVDSISLKQRKPLGVSRTARENVALAGGQLESGCSPQGSEQDRIEMSCSFARGVVNLGNKAGGHNL